MFNKAELWDGQLLHILARTGDANYVGFGLWDTREKLAPAMPQMISLLNSTRHLLEEMSPELGVTDRVSGAVVFENLYFDTTEGCWWPKSLMASLLK